MCEATCRGGDSSKKGTSQASGQGQGDCSPSWGTRQPLDPGPPPKVWVPRGSQHLFAWALPPEWGSGHPQSRHRGTIRWSGNEQSRRWTQIMNARSSGPLHLVLLLCGALLAPVLFLAHFLSCHEASRGTQHSHESRRALSTPSASLSPSSAAWR